MSKKIRVFAMICTMAVALTPFLSCNQNNENDLAEVKELRAQYDSIMNKYMELKAQSENLPTTQATSNQDSLINAQAAEINRLLSQLEAAKRNGGKNNVATDDSQLKKELQKKEETVKQLQKKLAQQEKELKNLQSQGKNSKNDAEVARLQKQISQQEKQIASLKGQVSNLNANSSNNSDLERQLKEAQQSNTNLTAKNKALGATNTDLNSQIKNLKSEVAELNQQVKSLQSGNNASNDAAKQYQSQVAQLQSQVAQLQGELKSTKSEKSSSLLFSLRLNKSFFIRILFVKIILKVNYKSVAMRLVEYYLTSINSQGLLDCCVAINCFVFLSNVCFWY